MPNFHIHFLNMDISLIMTVTCLEISIYNTKTHLEGSVSQNFDLGFSFHFIVCRRLDFAKNYKKIQKFPVFCHKI